MKQPLQPHTRPSITTIAIPIPLAVAPRKQKAPEQLTLPHLKSKSFSMDNGKFVIGSQRANHKSNKSKGTNTISNMITNRYLSKEFNTDIFSGEGYVESSEEREGVKGNYVSCRYVSESYISNHKDLIKNRQKDKQKDIREDPSNKQIIDLSQIQKQRLPNVHPLPQKPHRKKILSQYQTIDLWKEKHPNMVSLQTKLNNHKDNNRVKNKNRYKINKAKQSMDGLNKLSTSRRSDIEWDGNRIGIGVEAGGQGLRLEDGLCQGKSGDVGVQGGLGLGRHDVPMRMHGQIKVKKRNSLYIQIPNQFKIQKINQCKKLKNDDKLESILKKQIRQKDNSPIQAQYLAQVQARKTATFQLLQQNQKSKQKQRQKQRQKKINLNSFDNCIPEKWDWREDNNLNYSDNFIDQQQGQF